MKRLTYLFVIAALTLVYTNAFAQTEEPVIPATHGVNFVDADGDGYNDNAPDHDGDGIPNGADPDYTPLNGQGGGSRFVDLNGDGINDNAGKGNRSDAKGKGGYGPKDGAGNQGVGPKDGSGNGAGDGTNAGTGSQTQKRRGKK